MGIFYVLIFSIFLISTLAIDEGRNVLPSIAIICAGTFVFGFVILTLIADLFLARRVFPWWPRFQDLVPMGSQLFIVLSITAIIISLVFWGDSINEFVLELAR